MVIDKYGIYVSFKFRKRGVKGTKYFTHVIVYYMGT